MKVHSIQHALCADKLSLTFDESSNELREPITQLLTLSHSDDVMEVLGWPRPILAQLGSPSQAGTEVQTLL